MMVSLILKIGTDKWAGVGDLKGNITKKEVKKFADNLIDSYFEEKKDET